MASSLGLYVSIPFCRAKCTFCNFASDAFAPGRLPAYLDVLGAEIAAAPARLGQLNAAAHTAVDSIYLGGGTPSLLAAEDVQQLFAQIRSVFVLAPDAEITVECAPGQLAAETLAAFAACGVNRLSFGVQSFDDRETAAVGRQHTAAQCLEDLRRAHAAGIANLGLDLIAGLPHQTEASWLGSLDQAIAAGVQHLSVYLLEVDEDSRLGREVIASGSRYSAAAVPSDDEAAHFYELACDRLEGAGFAQYEISNFARVGCRSRHNRKYWRRQPYLGFGLDAHSMLLTNTGESVRFSDTDDLETYLNGAAVSSQATAGETLPILRKGVQHSPAEVLSPAAAFEETLFLGLRTTEGLRLSALERTAPGTAFHRLLPVIQQSLDDGLLFRREDTIALTARGRLVSNEVFSRLLLDDPNDSSSLQGAL